MAWAWSSTDGHGDEFLRELNTGTKLATDPLFTAPDGNHCTIRDKLPPPPSQKLGMGA